jgi:hypothetical protein
MYFTKGKIQLYLAKAVLPLYFIEQIIDFNKHFCVLNDFGIAIYLNIKYIVFVIVNNFLIFTPTHTCIFNNLCYTFEWYSISVFAVF